MTQREKHLKAISMAHSIKAVARALRYDAQDYDVKFPVCHADELDRMADAFLRLK